MNSRKGFTLIELLIVIGILAILSVSLLLLLNPIAFITRSRDGVRVSGLDTINELIQLYRIRNDSLGGSAQTVYVSLPDSSPICANQTLPKLPSGWVYACKPQSDYRKIDGTGWIPINFTLSDIHKMSVLPIDQTNTTASGLYHAYVTDPVSKTWVLTTLLESDRDLKEIARKDGGTDDARYETGTNLALWVEASGLTAYWPFDEGTGSTAYDVSGHGYNATPPPGSTFPVWVDGVFNKALEFTNTTNLLRALYPALDTLSSDSFSIAVWVKPQDANTTQKVLFKGENLFGISIHDQGADRGTAWQIELINSSIGGNTTSFYDNNYNEWVHLVLNSNKDNTGFRVYMNGSLLVDFPPTGEVGRTDISPIYIGDDDLTARNQIIDEARVYNRELGAQEISAMYRAGK